MPFGCLEDLADLYKYSINIQKSHLEAAGEDLGWPNTPLLFMLFVM